MRLLCAIVSVAFISATAYSAPCELPVKIVAGKIAPCDGAAVREETLDDLAKRAKKGAEDEIKLKNTEIELEKEKKESKLKLEAKEAELQVERNLNAAAQSRIAALTEAPDFWETPEFWGTTAFSIGLALGFFIATR